MERLRKSEGHETPTKKFERVKESLNSYCELPLNKTELTILKAIENSLFPITPLGISRKTEINHNYVKVCVRNLESSGFIHRACYGHYERLKNFTTLDGVKCWRV